MVNDAKYAIYGHPNYGPTFGDDIVIKDKSDLNIGS